MSATIQNYIDTYRQSLDLPKDQRPTWVNDMEAAIIVNDNKLLKGYLFSMREVAFNAIKEDLENNPIIC